MHLRIVSSRLRLVSDARHICVHAWRVRWVSEACLVASMGKSGGLDFFRLVLTFSGAFAVLFASFSMLGTSLCPVCHPSPRRHVSHLQRPGMCPHRHLEGPSALSIHPSNRSAHPFHFLGSSRRLHANLCFRGIRAVFYARVLGLN